MNFQTEIITWYKNNQRNLPWRETKDAYIIWLSEIILQQTRVAQGLPYFYSFLENFPTVTDFASASETKILKLWQGLGYYSRGRNMLFTAQQVVNNYQGKFPTQYDELIKLKGIGEYTAAAISSFSSGEARAVVDGNVFRVLSRYFGIYTPINSSAGKKQFYHLANEILDHSDPGLYNQAIMEFGALQCKPQSPDCPLCPLKHECFAFIQKSVNTIPVKTKVSEKKNRYFNYFVCTDGDKILMKKRKSGDIWQHLFDLPLIESNSLHAEKRERLISDLKLKFGDKFSIIEISSKKQTLTHQTIHVHFFALENYMINFNIETELKWVSLSELSEIPQPKIIHDFVQSYFRK